MAEKTIVGAYCEVSQEVACGDGSHDVVLQMTPWSLAIAFNPCDLLPRAAQLLSGSRCRHATLRLKHAASAVIHGQWLDDESYLSLLQEVEKLAGPGLVDHALQLRGERRDIAQQVLAAGRGSGVASQEMNVMALAALRTDCDALRWAALTWIQINGRSIDDDLLARCWSSVGNWPNVHRFGLLAVTSPSTVTSIHTERVDHHHHHQQQQRERHEQNDLVGAGAASLDGGHGEIANAGVSGNGVFVSDDVRAPDVRTTVLCELATDQELLPSLRIPLFKQLGATIRLTEAPRLLEQIVREEGEACVEVCIRGAIIEVIQELMERECYQEALRPQLCAFVRQLLKATDRSPWLLGVFQRCSEPLFDIILEMANQRANKTNEPLHAAQALSYAPVKQSGPALLELFLTSDADSDFCDQVGVLLENVIWGIREYDEEVVAFLRSVIWHVDGGRILLYAINKIAGADVSDACRTLMSRLPTIARTGMRSAIIETLGRIGSPEAIGLLMDEYDVASCDASRTIVADSVSSILARTAADEATVEVLSRTLYCGQSEVACVSVQLLAEHSSKDALAVLERALRHDELSTEIKIQILAAIREREDLSSLRTLVHCLEDGDDELLEATMLAVCGLLDHMKRDGQLEPRGLQAALRSACLPVAREAASVLTRHPTPQFTRDLIACILRGDPALGKEAGAAVRDSIDSRTIDGLVRHWMYGDACVSRSIEAAAGQWGSKAVGPLLMATRWRFAPARLHALRALAMIGGRAARCALNVARSDPNASIRQFAEKMRLVDVR